MTRAGTGVKTYNVNIKIKADVRPTEKEMYEMVRKHLCIKKDTYYQCELHSNWVTVEEVKNALWEELTTTVL